MNSTHSIQVVARALYYIENGLTVFPVDGKKPLVKGWPELRGITPKQVHDWNDQGLWKNVAMLTGEASGNICVIDFDGLAGYEMFKAKFPDLVNTKTVATGSGLGMHVYFKCELLPTSISINKIITEDGEILNIEFRADGRSVVMPPSIHPDTQKPYTFCKDVPTMKVADLSAVVAWAKSLKPEQEWQPPKQSTSYSGDLNPKLLQAVEAYFLARPHKMNDEWICCFPPETIVEGTFDTGLKVWYSGPIRHLETIRGKRLTVTPNHPVLTTRGWVAAGKLVKGDYLLSYSKNVGSGMQGNINHQNTPTSIKDVFNSLAANGRSRFAMVTALDFDGDGLFCEGNINIVGMNRELPRNISSSGNLQNGFEFEFVPTNNTTSVFVERNGSFSNRFLRNRFSLSDSLSNFYSPSGMLQPDFACEIQPTRIGDASNWNTFFGKKSRNGLATVSRFISELLDASAGQIALDELICIDESDFSGHVYDLQAKDSWILAQDIICSNCSCPDANQHKHGDVHYSFGYKPSIGFGYCFGCGDMNLKKLLPLIGMDAKDFGGIYEKSEPPASTYTPATAQAQPPIPPAAIPAPTTSGIPVVTRSSRLTNYVERLLDYDRPIEQPPVMFPLKALHGFGGMAQIIKPGKLIGIVGISGGGKTSLLETMVDGFLNYHAPSLVWSPEWTADEFIERSVQRYGGPSASEVYMHETFIWEQQNGIKNGVGREMPNERVEAAKASIRFIRKWQDEVGYLNMPFLTVEYLKSAIADTLATITFKPRVLVIDYLQLLHALEPNHYTTMYSLIMQIKTVCQAHGLVGVISSQVTKADTKGVAKSPTKRSKPELLDASSARYVNDDAFNLFITINPEFDPGGVKQDSVILNVAKNSMGRTGKLRVGVDWPHLSFAEEAHTWQGNLNGEDEKEDEDKEDEEKE